MTEHLQVVVKDRVVCLRLFISLPNADSEWQLNRFRLTILPRAGGLPRVCSLERSLVDVALLVRLFERQV